MKTAALILAWCAAAYALVGMLAATLQPPSCQARDRQAETLPWLRCSP